MNEVTPDESSKQTANEWLVKLQSPHLTKAQQQSFFTWLNQKPEHQQAYIEAEALWESLAALEQLIPPTPATEPVVSIAKPAAWYQRPQAIAASFVGILALLVIQFWPYPADTQYLTHVGEQRQLTLADGSNIHLNTNSNLQVMLNSDSRRVTMSQGEAFFTVSKDSERPFVIETPTGLVRVLGTSFNVRIDELETIVTVVEGKVGVARLEALDQATTLDYQPQITLSANQQISFADEGINATSTAVDAAVTATWRQGKQVYNGVPFTDVITDLNRYFAGDLKLGDPDLEKIQIVAVLDLRDRARAISALESTFNVVAVEKSAELTVLYPVK